MRLQYNTNRLVTLKSNYRSFCVRILLTHAIVIARKEIGLEVNAEKTKYMVMSRDQNSGQNGYIQIGNTSFETVEQFKYLGTTLKNQNSIHEEI